METKRIVVLMLFLSLFGIALGVIGYLTERPSAIHDASFVWHAEVDSVGEAEALVRGGKVDDIKHDVKKLVAALNGSDKDPETFRAPGSQAPDARPKVKLTKIKKGVAFVEVINAEYLTQRMGSSGAQAYLACVTFTLTENPRIKKVNFIFEEGDHAAPGVYSRKDFSDYYTIETGDGGSR